MRISTNHYNRSSSIAASLLSYTRYSVLILCLFLLVACSTATKKPAKKPDDQHFFTSTPKQQQPPKNTPKDEDTLKAISDLSRAQSALEKGDIDQASDLLANQDGNLSLLPLSKQADWWRTQSDLAYQRKDIEKNILAEQQLHPLQTASNRRKRIDTIFNRLLEVDRFSLQRLANSMKGIAYARDWLSLTLTATSMPATIQGQKITINNWQKRHKNNPISKNLPTAINQFLAVSEAPKKVALLLPASGSLAPYGKAIEEGFFSIQKGLDVQAQVYDVHNTSSLNQAMNAMARDGIDAVVGPIDKKLASQLWQSNRFPNLLTLNYITAAPKKRESYAQFGLGIEDEARLLAQITAYNNKNNVLVIYEKGSKGTRAFKAFKEHMARGRYKSLAFTNTKDLARGISKAVNVSPADIKQYRDDLKAYEKEKELQQGTEVDAETVSPTDKLLEKNTIDAVIVFASQINAEQVKPLLDFYYAFDTPVLASSSAYEFEKTGGLGEGYEGIFIADVPILGKPYADWHSQISAKPENFNSALTRFYALGVDAAIAMSNLHRLTQAPGIQIKGATGSLGYDQKKQIITRSPDLYFVRKGNLVQAHNRPAECSEEQRLCL